MKDLHLALLLLAAVLLVALYAYGKWQERQALKRFDETLRGGVGDALLQPPVVAPARSPAAGPRVEPRLEPHLGPGFDTYPDGDAVRAEPRGAVDAYGNAGTAADAGQPPPAPSAWVEDPELDCVIELRCAHPVDGVAIHDAVAPLLRLGLGLPVHVVAWDGRGEQWVVPDRFGFHSELLVAIQLAHRNARLDRISASRFIAAVQQAAVALEADFDPPDVDKLVEQAVELDRRCGQFDVRIGLTLESAAGAWDDARLAAATAACDFMPAGDGRWERRLAADGAEVAWLAAKFDSLLGDRLVVELDVPPTPPDAEPLRALFAAAETLAGYLDARVVDDNGRPIDAASAAAIEQQLAELQAQMRAAGIEPGSRRALRLYA